MSLLFNIEMKSWRTLKNVKLFLMRNYQYERVVQASWNCEFGGTRICTKNRHINIFPNQNGRTLEEIESSKQLIKYT